jgi:hypothetical protein
MPSSIRSGLPLSLSRSSGASRRQVKRWRRSRSVPKVLLTYERLERRWCPSTLYDFDLIARTAQFQLSGMGTGPSINDSGTVAFVGDWMNGAQGLFTGDGTAAGLKNINPSWSTDPNRVYGDPVEINDAGTVLAVDRYTAPGYTQYTLRTWDSSATSDFLVYARAGSPRQPLDSFDSISPYAAIDNNNDIVYSALDASSESPSWELQYQTSIVGNGSNVASLAAPQALRPVISDNPFIVARIGGTNSTADPLTGYIAESLPGPAFAPFGVAGPGHGFDQVGPAPGISADGNVIAFAGDLTAAGASALGLPPGPGIFARVLIPDPSKPSTTPNTIPV